MGIDTVLAEQMQTTEFVELEAPGKFYSEGEDGAVIVGRIRFREDRRIIGIAEEDRRRHLYVVGKTGMGKTTLLLNQIHADLVAGRGVCLVDPHGDLATSIVRILRQMFGSTANQLDMRRFMQQGKIVVLNLAPGNRLPEQVADAIGGLPQLPVLD